MVSKKLLTTIFIIIPFQAFSQMNGFIPGSRASGMGNTSVTIGDSYSLFNNIGALAQNRHFAVILANENRSRIEGLGTVAAGLTIPFKTFAFGLTASRFGDEMYNQQIGGVGISNKIGIVSLGAKANYIQYNMVGAGRRSVVGIDFGGTASLSPQLVFGAHAFNINQAKISEYLQEHLPTVLKAGLSYRPIKELMINVEAEKDVDFPAHFKAGLEYEIVKTFFVRTGINTAPFNSFYGLGLRPGWFLLDYALSNHIFLGYTHQFSLSFQFNHKQ